MDALRILLYLALGFFGVGALCQWLLHLGYRQQKFGGDRRAVARNNLTSAFGFTRFAFREYEPANTRRRLLVGWLGGNALGVLLLLAMLWRATVR